MTGHTNALQCTQSTRDNEPAPVEMPTWVQEQQNSWGEYLFLPEWEDKDEYRAKNGWKGRDLIHDAWAPVRIVQYYVQYGNGEGVEGLHRGGLGTTLTGIVHFTHQAESHAGYCHGGSMTSVFDDIVGWCAFLVTGECKPWSGFTVQINTCLKRPIRIDSILLAQAKIARIERRKIFVETMLVDPEDDLEHATGDGLVVMNRGVLPGLLTRESTDSIGSFATNASR